jgi:Flp pilus assembly protein TadG
MSEPRFLSRTTSLLRRFRSNSSGNLAVIFAFAMLPILSAIGSAIDYSMATRMRAKLQSAADAASVASISQKSPGYNAASLMNTDGSVGAAVTDANKIFNGNINGISGFSNLNLTTTVTKTGIQLASNVSFSADVPVTFMQVMGFQKLTVSGNSKSTASLPPYLDFYLMLDVSGSMGLPSTAAEQTRLSQINPDNFVNYPSGCTFACHFDISGGCGDANQKYATGNYCLGYLISRVSQAGYRQILTNHANALPSYRYASLPNSLYPNTGHTGDPILTPVSNCPTDGTDACIQLRLDAVGYALTQLFIKANAAEKVPNQFRVGLYPFIQHLYAYFALTSSINGSASTSGTINFAAANLASQLDTNKNASLGSGGTHIDNAFTDINNIITTVGTGGSATDTQPYIFLVTDGAQDPQTKGVPGGSWAGSNHATVINPTTVCTPLKNRGIIISVLYIPYQPINPVNAAFAGDEDDAANNNIPNIPASLQGCASPGFFFTANTPADITAALNAMFDHALVTAHITN